MIGLAPFDDASEPGLNRLDGTVLERSFAGPATLFRVALPGGQVVRVQRAAGAESGRLGEGARVRLGFAPGAATLLTR